MDVMFFWPSSEEGIAWLRADDDSWADRTGQAYDAAVERGGDETAGAAAS